MAATTALSLLSLISERLREQRLQDRDFREPGLDAGRGAGSWTPRTPSSRPPACPVPETVQVLAVSPGGPPSARAGGVPPWARACRRARRRDGSRLLPLRSRRRARGTWRRRGRGWASARPPGWPWPTCLPRGPRRDRRWKHVADARPRRRVGGAVRAQGVLALVDAARPATSSRTSCSSPLDPVLRETPCGLPRPSRLTGRRRRRRSACTATRSATVIEEIEETVGAVPRRPGNASWTPGLRCSWLPARAPRGSADDGDRAGRLVPGHRGRAGRGVGGDHDQRRPA